MNTDRYLPWAQGVAEKIRAKMAWSSEKNKDKIPYTTNPDGSYNDLTDSNRSWWTNGFWGGTQWLLYQATGEKRYAEIGRASTYKLERCLSDFYGMDHDVGFLFLLTAVADYKRTGNPDGRRIGLHAANLLAGRFNPVGQYIRAWNDAPNLDNRGWAIIDCLMNLNLLYWASEETGDPRYRQIAMRHADTVIQNFLRPDGSACHIVEFDPDTGCRVRDYGGQGYADGSAWSRGQGWAVYGFTLTYRHTGCSRCLEAARAVADYVLAHLPESGLVPIDFCQPPEPALEDGAGAAILASGLIELAKAVPAGEGERYLEAAVRILKALDTHRADWTHASDAILQNCSVAYHSRERHIPLVYGDFFFLEAVYQLCGIGKSLWYDAAADPNQTD